MTTPEIILTALVSLSPILSVLIALLALKRNVKNDTKKDAEDLGSMKTDLAYIKAGIDDLKSNDKAKDERLEKMSIAIAKIESVLDGHIKDKNAHNYSAASKKGGRK